MRIRIGIRFLQQRWLYALLAGGALAGLAPSGALAQTVTVPDGTDLSTLAAPVDGIVWVLDGNAGVSNAITLPTGVTGLAINGQSGVSTVTLTGGPPAGRFVRAVAGATNFTLSNIELTGGQTQVSPIESGGAIKVNVANGVLTMPVAGTVKFTGNTASSHGGAIFASLGTADSFLLDGGTGASIWFTGNKSTGNMGGAIYATPKVTINGGDITITGNTANASAGAISVSTGAGEVTLNAANKVTLSNNHSETNVGGAIRATGAVTIKGKVVDISDDSSDSGNTYGNGGAIWSSKMGSSANLNPSVVIDGEQITLANNKNLHAQGGAIFSRGSVAIGSDPLTASVKLNDNHSGSAGDNTGTGGAIDAYGSAVTVADQIAVTILGKDIEIAR
ncbi:MAG: hypothetical protein FWC42_10820, partial [Proteobacteria bacterium]|nr:hypothetical protein [Pseudomonadota bacterium]